MFLDRSPICMIGLQTSCAYFADGTSYYRQTVLNLIGMSLWLIVLVVGPVPSCGQSILARTQTKIGSSIISSLPNKTSGQSGNVYLDAIATDANVCAYIKKGQQTCQRLGVVDRFAFEAHNEGTIVAGACRLAPAPVVTPG